MLSFELLNYVCTSRLQIDMESILRLWSLFEYFLCAALQLFIFCFSAAQLEHLVSFIYIKILKIFSYYTLKNFKMRTMYSKEQFRIIKSKYFILPLYINFNFYINLGLANCAINIFLWMGVCGL